MTAKASEPGGLQVCCGRESACAWFRWQTSEHPAASAARWHLGWSAASSHALRYVTIRTWRAHSANLRFGQSSELPKKGLPPPARLRSVLVAPPVSIFGAARACLEAWMRGRR